MASSLETIYRGIPLLAKAMSCYRCYTVDRVELLGIVEGWRMHSENWKWFTYGQDSNWKWVASWPLCYESA